MELLRFSAALAVLFAHYNHFFIYGYAYDNYAFEAQPLFSYFRFFYQYGTRAVEVFWCLSGFVFFYRYGHLRDRLLSFRNFFWLRFSRLYPLHLATLVAVALLQWIYFHFHESYFIVELNNVKHFVLNLFFASYWGFQDGFSFDAPVWSVSLEVLAYAFFFTVSYWIGSGITVVAICLLSCLALNYFRGAEAVLVRCIFYFYLGGLSCHCYRLAKGKLGARWEFLVLIPVGALFAVAVWQFRRSTDINWVLLLAVPCALVILATTSQWFPGFLAEMASTLGNLTYASYLLHFPLQVLIMLLVGALNVPHHFAYSPYFLFGYLAVLFLLSHRVYLEFELPTQEFIRERTLRGPIAGV